jgi:hypothetical protein
MSSKAQVYLATDGTRVMSEALLDAVVLLSHVAALRSVVKVLVVAFEGKLSGFVESARETGKMRSGRDCFLAICGSQK